jgi:hypothetical protein
MLTVQIIVVNMRHMGQRSARYMCCDSLYEAVCCGWTACRLGLAASIQTLHPGRKYEPAVAAVAVAVLQVDKSIIGWDSTIGAWSRLENHCVLGEDVQVKVSGLAAVAAAPDMVYCR